MGKYKKGQLSAEMLLLIVVILAIVAIVAGNLMKSAKQAGKAMQNQSTSILSISEDASKGDTGDPCVSDDQCKSGTCDKSTYECT